MGCLVVLVAGAAVLALATPFIVVTWTQNSCNSTIAAMGMKGGWVGRVGCVVRDGDHIILLDDYMKSREEPRQ